MAAINVDRVSKHFSQRRQRLLLAGGWLRSRTPFEALRDVSLAVESGESVGIIGRNGSGKSTLLKLIAGVTLPTSGTVMVQGRVASLLELGAGFHPLLTGRENIYLNAGLLGMRHAQVDAVLDEIIRFSGVEEFIDQQVETYSSGMYVRLAFSVAVHTDPDIFLVDEVLAVGDEEFQRKCRRRIGELREQKKTLVFVSHDLGMVNALCERVVLLDHGALLERGTPQQTFEYYLRQVGEERGIHVLRAGAMEAVLCNGRVSLFRDRHEITSPLGLQVDLESLGRRHLIAEAEWTVTEASQTRCRTVGRHLRLPVALAYTLCLEDEKLTWEIELLCERDTSLSAVLVNAFIDSAYRHWIRGDLSGDFPDLLPGDTQWNYIPTPEQALEMAALPEENSSLPALVVQAVPIERTPAIAWVNSDYLADSRVLHTVFRTPDPEAAYARGTHRLLRLEFDTGVPRHQVRKRLQLRHTVTAGPLSARFELGKVRLAHEGQEITRFLHCYASLLVEQLWNDSGNLQWGAEQEIESGIVLTGVSRRLPFRLEWQMGSTDRGITMQIWLLNDAPLRVDEYHVSVLLPEEFDRWRTEGEAEVFTDFDPGIEHWQHLNRTYPPGLQIAASRADGLTVTLEADRADAGLSFRMTALNTTHRDRARVLQALRPGESGGLHFEPGRHLLFCGLLRAQKETGHDPATQVQADE